jgi:hypothetical protein
MPNAKQVEHLIAGVLDGSGNLNDSGKAFFSTVGTTTGKTIYADAGKVAAYATNTQSGGTHDGEEYVLLDSYGIPSNGEVYADGAYDIYLYDSSDVLVKTISNANYSIAGDDTITNVTAGTYTVLDTDELLLCDTTGGSISLTIGSTAAAIPGKEFKIVKTSDDAFSVVIAVQASDSIEDWANLTLNGQFGKTTIQSDGVTTWNIQSKDWKKGNDTASAATLILLLPGYHDVTGTTDITAITVDYGLGSLYLLHFDSSLKISHHATNLILPNGLDIITQPGDELLFVEYAAGDLRLVSCSRPLKIPGDGAKISRPIFTWNGAATAYTIKVGTGSYWVGEKFAWWDAELTTTAIGTPAADDWFYLYLDYSAITSGTEITNTELIWSAQEPTYDHAKGGWYNSDDRAIFAVLCNSGPTNILEFFHDGDFVVYADQIADFTTDNLETDFSDEVALTIPIFCRRAEVIFTYNYIDTTTSMYWRTEGQAGTTGHLVAAAAAGVTISRNTLNVICSSNLKIDIRDAAAGNNTGRVDTSGWYLPLGL